MPGTERSVTRHPPVLGGFSGVSVFFGNLVFLFVHHFYTISSKQACYFLHFSILFSSIKEDRTRYEFCLVMVSLL